MRPARVYRGGRLRTQGAQEDPLVTISLQVRQRQLADAAQTSRAAVVREAIDRLLTHVNGPLTRLNRPSSWRTGGASATRSTPRYAQQRRRASTELDDPAQTSKEMP